MHAYTNKNRQPEGHTVGCMARQVHETKVDVTLSYMPLGCPQWPSQEKKHTLLHCNREPCHKVFSSCKRVRNRTLVSKLLPHV